MDHFSKFLAGMETCWKKTLNFGIYLSYENFLNESSWLLKYSVVEFPNYHFYVTSQWTGILCLMLGNGSVSHGFFQGRNKHTVGIYFSDGWLENYHTLNL